MFALRMSLVILVADVWAKTPFMSEYEFSRRRDELIREEREYAGHLRELTADEKIVDNYLEYLKWQEFIATEDKFLPSVGLEGVLDDIVNSKVFKTLKKFPKGGNMHLHENHILSKKKMLDIVFASEDFEHLHVAVDVPESKKWRLDFFLNPPAGWEKVKGNPKYTKEKLLPHMTMMGSMTEFAKVNPTNSARRWEEMDPMFSRLGSKVIANVNIKFKYLESYLKAALEENVQYLEARSSISSRLYTLDPDPKYNSTGGKRYIDETGGEYELQENIKFIEGFVKKNPEFIGMRKIVNSYRGASVSEMYGDMEKAVRLYHKYPSYIGGFDMVGEEDKGNSLLYFMNDFMKMYDNTTGKSLVPFYLHNGETNWPDDLESSTNKKDPVGTLQNTYEAVLLGAKRVGHGLGFFKHPYLLNKLKEHQTAIEICPASNQLLGYVPDLRNHPANNFIRMGAPVILGADDPATFGYDHFTVDWYEAFMGWGLRLQDLRHLAINSLKYSTMPKEDINAAIKDKWEPAYQRFIADIKKEACAVDFDASTNAPAISRIAPREGPMKRSTKVYVFGRNFEEGICKGVRCKFGNAVVPGSYISGQHVSCNVSGLRRRNRKGAGKSKAVGVAVSVDGGATYISYDGQFTFVRNL
ncbi:adenosine deaminase 2-A [Lingula anatina]|uniref:Adenosine deaminase 2-A n=1 Tax=Lingula anatina TaxID=7574 RepID=A0A1S3JIA8_LINAN|nr:adenosine deaminase 2-A [Lingula anatina]|eukprot:XP_013410098.1 adenosine deaminase 2-A [Lingula anatina]